MTICRIFDRSRTPLMPDIDPQLYSQQSNKSPEATTSSKAMDVAGVMVRVVHTVEEADAEVSRPEHPQLNERKVV